MKIFAIAISLAFLGASHSVHGAFPKDPSKIGDVFEDGLCSLVRGLDVCPPHNSLPCTYETVKSKNRWFGMYQLSVSLPILIYVV